MFGNIFNLQEEVGTSLISDPGAPAQITNEAIAVTEKGGDLLIIDLIVAILSL